MSPRGSGLPVDKQFKPGQSGNPKGRPKGDKEYRTRVRERLKKKVDATDPVTGKMKKRQLFEVMLDAQIKKATGGDSRAFNAIMDRAEGKPVQQLEHTGKDGQPLANLPPLQIVVEGVEGSEEPNA